MYLNKIKLNPYPFNSNVINKDKEAKEMPKFLYVGLEGIIIDAERFFEQFNRNIKNVVNKINALQEDEGLTIQLLNSEAIISPNHIYKALFFMMKAYNSGNMISTSKNLEFMIYLSGQRQIKIALDMLGINNQIIKNKIPIYLVIISDNSFDLDIVINKIEKIIPIKSFLNLKSDSDFHKSNESLMKIKHLYNISDSQLDIVKEQLGFISTPNENNQDTSKQSIHKQLISSDKSKDLELNTIQKGLTLCLYEKMSILSLEKK